MVDYRFQSYDDGVMINKFPAPIMTKPLRACMLVIADEVLSGKILDTNSHHLGTDFILTFNVSISTPHRHSHNHRSWFDVAKLAFNHGIQLSKISVISDCEETIAAEVLDASNTYDYVFTSGGIGKLLLLLATFFCVQFQFELKFAFNLTIFTLSASLSCASA